MAGKNSLRTNRLSAGHLCDLLFAILMRDSC
jgi:hypothetical protein